MNNFRIERNVTSARHTLMGMTQKGASGKPMLRDMGMINGNGTVRVPHLEMAR